MSVINIVKTVKEIHPEFLTLVKIGSFYHAYGKDSYILSYLFQYKLKTIENNYSTCGFSSSTLNKVLAKLELEQINYLILDRRNNYEVDEKCDYKKKNQYKKIFDEAYPNIKLRNRVEAIYQYMLDNIHEKDFKNILVDMEKIIYERRKV